MPIETEFTRRLGLSCPVIQAPMAGGADSPALAAAVSAAGGLGSLGLQYLTPTQAAEAASFVRTHAKGPFGVNLFAPQPPIEPPADLTPALAAVAPYYAELGLPPPSGPSRPNHGFDEQFAVVLDSGAAVFSFTFGLVPPEAIAAAKARGMLVMGTATSVAEARALEEAGVDAVVVQGAEAGGHRGTFAHPFEEGLVGTMALVPQVVDAVRLPVVASGGIMDGRGIAAALSLGASAVQLGTAFLTCDEAGAPEAYKAAILDATEAQTRVTRVFSGRPARGIVNRFLTEVEASGVDLPPFPLQNSLTQPLRAEARRQGRAEYLSLWAGQGLTLARRQPAAELVARLMAEAEAVIGRLARL